MHFGTYNENKLLGEQAELEFMLKAVKEGFKVSKPHGDNARYDFILDGGKGLKRVQLKSTHQLKKGYRITCLRGKNLRSHYTPNEVDAFVVYLAPIKVWYVFPMADIQNCKTLYFSRMQPPKHDRWSAYREAWHLLSGGKVLPWYHKEDGNKNGEQAA